MDTNETQNDKSNEKNVLQESTPMKLPKQSNQQESNPQQQNSQQKYFPQKYPQKQYPSDVERDNWYLSDVDNAKTLNREPIHIRHAFIRKVYMFLCINLIVMSCVSSFIYFIIPVHLFLAKHYFIFLIPFSIHLVLFCVLIYWKGMKSHVPFNLILFFTSGVTSGFCLGSFCIFMQTYIGLSVIVFTIFIVLVLILLTFQNILDVTGGYIYIVNTFLIMIMTGICTMGFPFDEVLYCGICSIICSCLIVFDARSIMGSRKHLFSAKHYMETAIHLFIDTQLLFTVVPAIISAITSD